MMAPRGWPRDEAPGVPNRPRPHPALRIAHVLRDFLITLKPAASKQHTTQAVKLAA